MRPHACARGRGVLPTPGGWAQPRLCPPDGAPLGKPQAPLCGEGRGLRAGHLRIGLDGGCHEADREGPRGGRIAAACSALQRAAARGVGAACEPRPPGRGPAGTRSVGWARPPPWVAAPLELGARAVQGVAGGAGGAGAGLLAPPRWGRQRRLVLPARQGRDLVCGGLQARGRGASGEEQPAGPRRLGGRRERGPSPGRPPRGGRKPGGRGVPPGPRPLCGRPPDGDGQLLHGGGRGGQGALAGAQARQPAAVCQV
mmetsp:Transcript_29453/g.70144  ORF Transcript_29453/g.70144 Transcript_29453/m.70144 type:complete len:256 (-) Transcript_29453:931-1698(-)